ncbi:murein L,D-transpeptidase [Alsobacter soli]|uniref:Murein L,D-transpeptidase n=2 Tax=Alsobacter soli TaxID=2109933 RepID=A0A2T1HZU4_9HYPH|nr:murein L,D-transpeptidase [Alsobacter soli]
MTAGAATQHPAAAPAPAAAENSVAASEKPSVGAADVVVPLPDEPSTLIVEEAAAPAAPAQPKAAEKPAEPAAPAVAAAPASPAVDIPPPDLPPVTVVIDASKPDLSTVEADALRATLKAYAEGAAKVGKPVARLPKKEREALAAFYAGRDDKPVWFADGQPTAAAKAVLAQIATAEDDALDPASYPAALPAADAGPADRAEADLSLSAAAVAYARDARGARIEPSRLSNLITPDLALPEPAEVLAALAQAADAGKALAAYQPPHPGYLALKAKLHEMRESTGALHQQRDEFEGPPLRYGSTDPRVPLIRAKLSLDPKPDQAYDDELIAAVKAFQRARRVRATGIFDQHTADLLTGRIRSSSSNVSMGDVIANMERWRWLPQDLGERHIEVNLPEYTLRLYENGQVVHRTRVVVGKATSPTPIFSHMMEYVIVNPSWYVPPSIIKNEFLPKMAQDPNYAARQGYEVIRKGNRIFVRQPPGERNALGFIKFMFPNQHAVYLHDTPSRGLFANEKRAFSHGCVRVENPFRLADFVLGDQGYDEKRLRGLIGKGERTIRFKHTLPIHLTYFTVSVDETGRLVRREDLYGYDGRVRTALGLASDGRRFAHAAEATQAQRQP